MLKWTSKGSLNSEEMLGNQVPYDLSWHKPRESVTRRIDPGKRSLAETAEQRRLHAYLSADKEVFDDGLRRKRSLASEPNSPHCSTEDVRHFRSLSLPSSPLTKKKSRYGVFKRLRNMFRKGKGGSSDNFGEEYIAKSNLKLPSPGSQKKGQKVKVDKKGRKGVPKTRLTRLIEAKRGQRKAGPPGDNRYALGESPSFITPSTSSDEEGYATFLRNDMSDGHLGTFAAHNKLHTFPARGDQATKADRFLNRGVYPGVRLVKTSGMEVPQMVEEPKVIARYVRGLDGEMEFTPVVIKSHSSEVKRDSAVSISPIQVESFIMDVSRYESMISPVLSSQLSPFDKYLGQGGANGIRKPCQRTFEDNEDDSGSSRQCVSTATVQELTRSLSLIRESGSLEKVRVMFSSSESIAHARSMLSPVSDRQSPSSKFTSPPNSVIVDTIALHSDNGDQWLSQEGDQTLLFPSQSSSMNDFFYKTSGDTHEEYSHQNPLCTRNNNNGHHHSPLVSTTTLYDLPPDVHENFFKPSYYRKTETNVDAYTSTRTEIEYSDCSFVSSPPLSPLGEKSRTSDTGTIHEDFRSDSDSKYSSLDTDRQSLVSIQPKRVKDIVDQIERESLNSVNRFSPTERASERRLREVESIKQTESIEKKRNVETEKASAQDIQSSDINERAPKDTVELTGVEQAADIDEKLSGDNYSTAFGDDTYSRSDVAEQDLTSPESSSFHMSEHAADDQNTYISDTNAFYSDNSDVLTCSSFSKEGEDPERDTKFAPVVHMVCNSLMNSFSFDTKSEQDFQEEQISGRSQSCGDLVQPKEAENHLTPLSASAQVSYCNVSEHERNHCCSQEITNIERAGISISEDFTMLLQESSPEMSVVQEHEEEPNLARCEFRNIEIVNYMSSALERDDGAEMTVAMGSEEEGITDVIAPKLMMVLDSSLQDNVSEPLENKSAMSDGNTSQCSNNNFEQPGIEKENQESNSSVGNAELNEKTVVSPVDNGNIFYMPECALEEFNIANIADNNVQEMKSKKKVSFKLDVHSPEESSLSDDRAVLETTLPQRRRSAGFLAQSNEPGVRESESSTDVSITELSNKQSELIGGLTPPITSTSGDDFSWWGTENIDDIDFLHDEYFSIDEVQPQPQDNNVAPSSATENLLQEELSSTDFGQPENCHEEDVCGTSNILTLSSFLTSGSIFNMNADDRQALFLTVDNDEAKRPETPNDIAQEVTIDEKSWQQSDLYQGDSSVNKQSETPVITSQENADEMPRNEMDSGQSEEPSDHEPEEEAVEDELDEDQASDINTHTYNVVKEAEENERQAWWENNSGASATNFSIGSFEIDSQDESNTLSDLYNQLKSSKHSNRLNEVIETLEYMVVNEINVMVKEKSPEEISRSSKSKAHVKFEKEDSTESEGSSTKCDSSRNVLKIPEKSESNFEKRLKLGKVSVIDATGFLDKKDADREVMSGLSQSTGTMRLSVSPGDFRPRSNVSSDTSGSFISYSDKIHERPRRHQTVEDDDDNTTSPTKSAKLWERASYASASVASDGPFTSDEDCLVEVYSRDSPYYIDNAKEYIGSVPSSGEAAHESSVCSSSQSLTDSCVIDNFADYVSVSSQNASETSPEPTGSMVTGYTDTYNRNVLRPMYHNRSVNATLKLVQNNINIAESHYQPTQIKYKEATHTDAYYCLNKRISQKATASNCATQKYVETNESTPSSHNERTKESRSGKSQTLAVAESDTTATSDLLSLDVFSASQLRPNGNGKDAKAKVIVENSELSAGGGQRKRAPQLQQSAINGAPVKQTSAGGYQQSGYYNYSEQDGQGQQQNQPPREQRPNDSQHQRSRFTCRGEGGTKSRSNNEQSSPGSSCHTCPNWKKTDNRAQRRPGEWLFIASFFIFQLFMHWVYA